MPHSIIHGDACFAYFNKIWGIPVEKRAQPRLCCKVMMGLPLRNQVLAKDKAGGLARDKNAMAGERAAERKANIRELGYRSVELVQYLGRELAEHRSPLVRR